MWIPLFNNHHDQSCHHYFVLLPHPRANSLSWISALKGLMSWGTFKTAPSLKAPKACLPVSPFSFAPFLCQLSSLIEASGRRRPRCKQVPGCQSRTRPEQERTGSNRREQIPAGPARAPPPPARPAIHTAYVARRSHSRSHSLACWRREGAGPGAAALPLYTLPAGDRFDLARATLTPLNLQQRK